MRILIDECLPVALKGNLTAMGHECQAVRHAGFGSKKNGELLTIAEGRWDVLLTSDRNIKYQQKHDWAQRIHPDPLRKIESHERFVATHASLRPGASFYQAWPGGRRRASVVKWLSKPFRLKHRITAPDTTIRA